MIFLKLVGGKGFSKHPLILCGALKSMLVNEGRFGYFGMQIEEETIKMIGKSPINTRGSRIGFNLHIREKETRKPSFPVLKQIGSSSSSLCAPELRDGNAIIVGGRLWEHHHRRRAEIGERGQGIVFPVGKMVGSWLFVDTVFDFVGFLCFRWVSWDFRRRGKFGRSRRRRR